MAAILAVATGCSTKVENVDCLENPDLGICQPTTVDGNTNPARIYVDPPFGASFSCVLLGCNETRMMTIENRGGVTLGISRVALESDMDHDFSIALFEEDAMGNQMELMDPTYDAPLLIETGKSVRLMVQYIPADGTEDVATLMIDWFNGNRSVRRHGYRDFGPQCFGPFSRRCHWRYGHRRTELRLYRSGCREDLGSGAAEHQ